MSVIKKITIYFVAFLLICFILPGLLTTRKKEVVSGIENNEAEDFNQQIQENQPYQYQKFSTIKLLHTKTGEIEEIPLDTYLYNVVSAEMPADYELEALKAQSVVARTYTIYQITNSKGKHEGADMCDDYTCCQAWISKEDRLAKWDENLRESNWNKIVEAVNSTAGKVITYNNVPIDAFFIQIVEEKQNFL